MKKPTPWSRSAFSACRIRPRPTKSSPNTAASIVKQDPTAGIRGETTVIGYPLHLASSTKVSDKTVATLLKAWWDNLGELQTIHPQFKKWTKDVQAITNFTVPYHDGAVKFYKEAERVGREA